VVTPFSPDHLIAAAEALNGNFAQARIDYALAIDLLAKGPHRPQLAPARLGLAEVLLDRYHAEGPEAVTVLISPNARTF